LRLAIRRASSRHGSLLGVAFVAAAVDTKYLLRTFTTPVLPEQPNTLFPLPGSSVVLAGCNAAPSSTVIASANAKNLSDWTVYPARAVNATDVLIYDIAAGDGFVLAVGGWPRFLSRNVGVVLASTDGAQTWQVVLSVPSKGAFVSVVYSPKCLAWIVCGEQMMMISSDLQQWALLVPPTTIDSGAVLTEFNGPIMVTGSWPTWQRQSSTALWYSTDCAQTWTASKWN
jgi:hypothetical protein